VYFFELSRERDWFAPDRAGARPPFVIHQFVIRQLRHSIINARVPQEPPLGVMDEIAVARKVDGFPDVGSGCPTRFVGATTVATVNHIEAVYSGLDWRIGGGGNAHARDGNCQPKTTVKKLHLTIAFMKSSIRNLIEVGNDNVAPIGGNLIKPEGR
jgi:hypothetical protein